MGDNANVKWQWHNTEVGKGYQARGVVRQPGQNDRIKITDMSVPQHSSHELVPKGKTKETGSSKRGRKEECSDDDDNDDERHTKKRKSKKEKKSKKKSHKKEKKSKDHKKRGRSVDEDHSSSDEVVNFNPILQYLATHLSNKTRVFTLDNE